DGGLVEDAEAEHGPAPMLPRSSARRPSAYCSAAMDYGTAGSLTANGGRGMAPGVLPRSHDQRRVGDVHRAAAAVRGGDRGGPGHRPGRPGDSTQQRRPPRLPPELAFLLPDRVRPGG